jgi:ataxin-3
MSSNPSNTSEVWIYHERQQALLCGQHALNNLAQASVFDAGMLADIAESLDAMERQVLGPSAAYTPSANVDAQGNFSIQVLKVALQNMYDLQLPHLSVIDKSIDIASLQGFICHKSDHWFAIRQIGGRFWNLNSMLELPVPISHFNLAKEMQEWGGKEGYTIFAIERGLPPAGQEPGKTELSSTHGAYHRMDDLVKGKATPKDPWANLTGAGMRLASSSHNQDDDDLQRALRMSLQDSIALPSVSEEPPLDAVGCVKIQLKLPDGQRLVRRFLTTDSVGLIYAVCQQAMGNQKSIELKYGFPPKDMSSLQSLTIEDARLANESIQARYL